MHLVNQVRTVLQDCLAQWDIKVFRDQLDNPELLVFQVSANLENLEFQDTEVHLVLQVHQDRRESQAQQVLQVSQVLVGLWVQRVHKVIGDFQVRQVHRGLKVMPVLLGHLVQKVKREIREQWALQVNQVFQGHQVHKVLLVLQDIRVPKVSEVIQGHQAAQELWVQQA